jgi:cysteine synthase
VLLKREDQQPVFSFKLRGAYNKMAHLSPSNSQRGVICASAGNHAQGVALSARKLGCRAVIVMPVTTPQVKIDAVRALGGEVVCTATATATPTRTPASCRSASTAHLRASLRRPRRDRRPGHDRHGDPAPAHSGPLDAMFVAIGGGGLIAGVANYIKAVRPEIRVIGVQTGRLRRDDAARSRRAPRHARRRRPVRRRHGGEARGRGNLPDRPALVDEIHARRHRRGLRGHQGRLRGHPQHRSSRPARWPSPAIKQYVATHKPRGKTSSPSPAAPT